MTHYAPDREGVERLGKAYLVHRTKMSQNRHANEGLPVVFNGKIACDAPSTGSKATLGE